MPHRYLSVPLSTFPSQAIPMWSFKNVSVNFISKLLCSKLQFQGKAKVSQLPCTWVTLQPSLISGFSLCSSHSALLCGECPPLVFIWFLSSPLVELHVSITFFHRHPIFSFLFSSPLDYSLCFLTSPLIYWMVYSSSVTPTVMSALGSRYFCIFCSLYPQEIDSVRYWQSKCVMNECGTHIAVWSVSSLFFVLPNWIYMLPN